MSQHSRFQKRNATVRLWIVGYNINKTITPWDVKCFHIYYFLKPEPVCRETRRFNFILHRTRLRSGNLKPWQSDFFGTPYCLKNEERVQLHLAHRRECLQVTHTAKWVGLSVERNVHNQDICIPVQLRCISVLRLSGSNWERPSREYEAMKPAVVTDVSKDQFRPKPWRTYR